MYYLSSLCIFIIFFYKFIKNCNLLFRKYSALRIMLFQ